MNGAPATEGDARRAALAIDALRRGWAINVEHLGQALCLLPIETARDVAGAHAILLSASRAATLKLMNQRAAADTALPVMIRRQRTLISTLRWRWRIQRSICVTR